MNFLGHLLLTYPHPAITMGNLLGDMIRSKEAKVLSKDLQTGFSIHHEIDSSTDKHPSVRNLIALLRPQHGKYAPVVVDILLDHVLARQWNEHATISYPHFTQWVYDFIPDFLDQLPVEVAQRLRSMREHRWIDGYQTSEKLRGVLRRMDLRASFPSNFEQGAEDYPRHKELFHESFMEFYGPLQARIALRMEEMKHTSIS
jgi:acyl carrier protein phosphodiesterase